MALGIGSNTALFSVVYSTLFRPLPFRDPSRLVQISETHPALPQLQVTAADYQDFREQARSFEQLAAYTLSAMNTATLLGQGEPAIIHGTMAASNLFPLMGIEPVVGRPFTAAEEAAKQHVALISEDLWRRKFAADAAVIGRAIRIDQQPFQVVGVISKRQTFPEWADFWIPLSLMESDLQTRRKFHPLEVMGRLKRDVTAEQANTEIRTIASGLARAHPDTNATIGAYVIPLARELTQAVRPSLLLAWAAVGLVLLIACANLAHLLLARIIERRDEFAVRRALGAGAWDLIRQISIESMLIAAIGGVAGMLSALWAGQVLHTNVFDAPVWLFASGISIGAGILFALPACWEMRSRGRLAGTGRSLTRARSRLSAALLAGEVAIAVLVLSGTALLVRNFAALLSEDPGFQAKQIWTIPRLPLRAGFDQSAAFLSQQLTPALLRVPGVAGVAAINSAPMSLGPTEHSRFATRFGLEGRKFEPGSYPVTQNRWVTTEYFRILGIALKQGRWLTETDRNQPRILINETLARRFFPGQDAVGKRLVLGVMDRQQSFNEIAGVVGDVRDMGLDQDVEPTIYGIATGPVMTLVVKTAGDPGALRDAIHKVDPEIAVTTIQPLAQNVSESLARRRFVLMSLAIFAAMAMFLTAGGIYGLLTQSVNARVREFGVRAAIGAAPRELRSMILREAFRLSLPGLVGGVVLAIAFSGVMRSFVYRLSPADPASIGCAAAFLLYVVLLSAWIPARRAAAMDPAAALRRE